jgi:KaiC/GvpD/RAD55 family RecA-like ATPase
MVRQSDKPAYQPEEHARQCPLDRVLSCTEFADRRGKTKAEFQASLRDIAEKIKRTTAPTKDQLPWFKGAEFGDQLSTRGSLRHNANMTAISAVELDYDNPGLSPIEAWGHLYDADLPGLIYTSPRHTEEKPKFRVVLPTSRPLPPAERERLVARAYGVLGGALDPASFVQCQAFYFGSAGSVQDDTDGPGRDGVPVQVDLVDIPGRYIDQAHDLDEGALGKDGLPYRPRSESPDTEPVAYSPPDAELLVDMLRHIPGAEYDDWMRVGMILKDIYQGAEEGFQLWDGWSWEKQEGNYDSVRQRSAWESFGTDPMRPQLRIGSLIRMAKKAGWTQSHSMGALRLLSTKECELAKRPKYIWKGMIAEEQVVCVFGAPGAGKSLFAPYLAMKVAHGESAFGMKTKAGVVLYVAAEDGSGMQLRIASLARRHGHTPKFQMVDGLSDLHSDRSTQLAALLEIVEAQRPALIVIDTLAAAFPGLEENDAKSMGGVVSTARKLAQYGAAVILVHHGTKAEGGTPRGHSILNGALDMAIHIKKGEGGIVRGVLTKNRNGTIDRDIAFRIDTEDFEPDEDGDAISAAIAVELDGAGAPRQSIFSGAQRGALAVLDELTARESLVSYEEWKAACMIDLRVSDAPQRKSRQAAFRRLSTALIASSAVVVNELGVSRG